ncbi:MAG TPA: hypothetical protein VGF59_01730 [Bryobacteraceae bacterium]
MGGENLLNRLARLEAQKPAFASVPVSAGFTIDGKSFVHKIWFTTQQSERKALMWPQQQAIAVWSFSSSALCVLAAGIGGGLPRDTLFSFL